jgi:hypothetical protein
MAVVRHMAARLAVASAILSSRDKAGLEGTVLSAVVLMPHQARMAG